MIEQARVKGRHAHQRRRRRHRRDHRVGIEAVLIDHRRPRQQRDIDRDEEPVGMEHRQRVNEPIGGGEPPAIDKRQARSTTDSRGSASRPSNGRSCPTCRGSPPDRRWPAGPSRNRRANWRSARRTFRHARRRGSRPRDRPSLCASARIGGERIGSAQRQRRLGVGKEIFELGERIGGVQRQQRRAGAKARERDHDHIGRFVDLRRDPVAGLDAERDQRVGRTPRAFEQPVVGQGSGVGRLQRQLAGLPRARGDEIEQIGGSGFRHGNPRVDAGVALPTSLRTFGIRHSYPTARADAIRPFRGGRRASRCERCWTLRATGPTFL